MKAFRGEAVACTTKSGLGVKTILLRKINIRGMVRKWDVEHFMVNCLLNDTNRLFEEEKGGN